MSNIRSTRVRRTLSALDDFLPSQCDDFRRTSRVNIRPEKKLMLALLEGTIKIYQEYKSIPSVKRRTIWHEAWQWFESVDRTWPYSFENVCDALGIDAGYLRKGLGITSGAAFAEKQ